MRRSLLWLLGSALTAVFLTAQGAEPRDPYQHFFNETWGDFQEELASAREQGKRGIFVFFEMDECPFCHYMKNTVLNQPAVQAYYRENFLNFAVDIEGDVEVHNFDGESMSQKDFAFKEHRVRATPVLAFFDLEGQRILRSVGKTADAQEFLWMGEFVSSGAYEEMPFTRYKREKRQAGG